ncbi:MAG: hypothetical protein A6F70_09845 [Cycloclasticus sp. symbiont of Bathymodiolus heckerae]|nr:MAG: hypothetical protein A6F70_09845 [Cycloclasticus sp. symbiont of Bathymodiolus heckerae]
MTRTNRGAEGISGRVKFLPLAWAGMPKTSFRKNSDSPLLLLNNIVTQVKTPQTKYQSTHVSPGSVTQASTHPAKQYQAGDLCPECNHPLEVRTAIRGKKIGQIYIGCSHFPDCRFYAWPKP